MYDVITIGTVVRDVFLRSSLFTIVKDPEHLKAAGFPTGEAQCFALGGKIPVDQPILSTGGGAVNSAVMFARQGYHVGALVKVGDDENGHAALSELREENIEPLVISDTEHMTGYSVLLIGPKGERTILTFRGASDALTEEEVPFSKLKAKWVYIVPAQIPFEVMMSIVSHFKKVGVRIAMDPSKHYLEMGSEKLKPILSCLDIVKMNKEEAALLTGKDYDDEKGIFTALDELVPGIAVMTDGPNGVIVSDGAHVYRAGTYEEKRVADRTGAGDAFGAGLVSSFIKEDDMSSEAITRAIRLGSANATSVVEHVGAHTGALTKEAFENEDRWKSLEVSQEDI